MDERDLQEQVRYCQNLKNVQCTYNEARLVIGQSLRFHGLSRRLADTICREVYGEEMIEPGIVSYTGKELTLSPEDKVCREVLKGGK